MKSGGWEMWSYKRLLLYILMIINLLLVSWEYCEASYQEYGQLSLSVKESEYLQDTIVHQFDNSALLEYNLKINEGDIIGCFKLNAYYSQNYDEIFFNLARGYVVYQNDYFSFELGKNRVMNGVGYAWNPSDIINLKKSPLYREEEKRIDEGVYYTSLSYYGFLNDLAYEVRGIILPEEDSLKSSGVFSTKISWQSLEASFLTGLKKDEPPVYAGS